MKREGSWRPEGQSPESARAEASDAVIRGQSRALELVLMGAPLAEVLTVIVQTVEAQSQSDVLASILLVGADGAHLLHGAAPSLPPAYCQAIDGIAIGPQVGSCGTAAFTKQTAVAEDIASHPAWADFKGLALEHELRACWSTPILSSRGEVLGTFALYHHQPSIPADRDVEIVELLSRTASLVIERQRAESLHKSERRRVLEVLESTQDSFFALDEKLHIALVNKNQERTS